MMRVNRMLALLSVAAVGFAVAGSTSAAPAPPEVSIGGIASLNYLPAYVADAAGFFRRNNVKVSFLAVSSTAAALIQEDIQFSLNGSDFAFVTAAQGHPTPLVMMFFQRNPSTLVVRSDLPGVNFNARYPANVRSLPKGFTFAVPNVTGTKAYMNVVFGGAGLQEGKDYSVVVLGTGPAAVAALRAGRVDAAYGFPPYSGLMTTAPGANGRALLREARGEGPAVLLTRLGAGLHANRDWVARFPGVTKRIVTAITQAQEYMHVASNRKRIIDIAVKYIGVNDRAVIGEFLDDMIPQASPHITCARLAGMVNYEVEGGNIDVRPPCNDLRIAKLTPTKPIPPKIIRRPK